MNWRNPFLITYLSITGVGALALGYMVYSSYAHATEVDTNYTDAVATLQKLQNRVPFPNPENNKKYVEYTEQYRAEYDKLLAKVATMQKSVETVTPQLFQDRLRSDVSEVEAAAKQNGVTLAPNFYLGFDQYRGTLPSDEAAGPLARELAAIRLVVDRLVALKVRQIVGIKRDMLPEEGGNSAPAASSAPVRSGRPQPGGGGGGGGSRVVTANNFEVAFEADQNATRSALDFIANADQFFIIRYLTVQNSALVGPKKTDDEPKPTPSPNEPLASQPLAGAAAGPHMRRLAGWETLVVSLRIEMITFNMPSQK